MKHLYVLYEGHEILFIIIRSSMSVRSPGLHSAKVLASHKKLQFKSKSKMDKFSQD